MSKTKRELEDDVIRAHAASAFLQNPQLLQAVEDVKTEIFNEWVNSESQPPEYRERLWFKWHALDDILKGLRKPVDEGTLASNELKRMRYQGEMERT